ncbi:MAG TPA: sorbosone dehydrogenase family protein [Bryobacteraceae bacterium]|nr:sorbosone dehydrogenase family protein [Bryobacteraceae bacterium]
MRWRSPWGMALASSLAVGAAFVVSAAGPKPDNSDAKNVITGKAAFDSYLTEKPGTFRKITVDDLPQPFATKGVGNSPTLVPRPSDAWPKVPAGFKIDLYANNGLVNPRKLLTAPNGDLFLADTNGHSIRVFRGITKDGKPEQTSTFTTDLPGPFGIAFYPVGKNPKWVYVSNTSSVVRFPYKDGDLKASGPAQTIIPDLNAKGGHSTRDLAFSPDGTKLFVAVGSGSNIDDPDTHPRERVRAQIREYTPDGKFVKIYASGIRNPVGLAINPTTGQLWCSTNERDMIGDNLVPDYITHVQEGGFYGWPWYYIGNHHDPRLPEKPELASKVIVPDILLQPHNASLELTFYGGKQFPKQYRGDVFAAEHGSWNKAVRAGYEVIRAPLNDGKAVGDYEDFVTGFVTPQGQVWGRPVGVAVAPDGSLMVSDDGSNSIWRVSYVGQ